MLTLNCPWKWAVVTPCSKLSITVWIFHLNRTLLYNVLSSSESHRWHKRTCYHALLKDRPSLWMTWIEKKKFFVAATSYSDSLSSDFCHLAKWWKYWFCRKIILLLQKCWPRFKLKDNEVFCISITFSNHHIEAH